MTPTTGEVWKLELRDLRIRLSRFLDAERVIAPNGLRLGDLDGADVEDLPAEPLLAAWATVMGTDGLRRAARRWVTAGCAPIFATERDAEIGASAARTAAANADLLEIAGPDAVSAVLEAAVSAETAGVRIHPHQTATVEQIRNLTRRRDRHLAAVAGS